MQSEEQRLIDGLFGRLKKAEENSTPRDAAAEQLIERHLAQLPGAAYYMAQTILIQEAALKQLNSRIQGLEGQVAQLQHASRQQQSSGGFLAGLFGSGSSPAAGTQPYQSVAPGGYNAPQTAPGYTTPRGGNGFMAGALQTAAGVAGGVIMADMLTSMFHHTQPEELVNIINEPAQPTDNAAINAVDDYNQAEDSQFLNQDAGLPQDDTNDYGDIGNDDLGNDDDNLI
ncbi:DUF2076 domain-containing protein [Enterobacteriaceae bacterium H20N1]|uniref:DUF2076 domain-containing protein n=1 Tax=Dryocola boscaweniae TaxID=2925397 RepID=A0A9X3AA52_9ENTR|nr:DUF2076 domain-containing protein [Dryocola boscaweniae]MCT4701089.1 DUF2076 domain-containing protein [Dryocola boscaweniae]MCT4718133.1 DUF2076 domain-containing protein [Dryocola boscaweniae]